MKSAPDPKMKADVITRRLHYFAFALYVQFTFTT